MLVLSRREEESIRMPDLGVTVKIVRIQGERIKLAIEAPKDVRICRKETAAPVHSDHSVIRQA